MGGGPVYPMDDSRDQMSTQSDGSLVEVAPSSSTSSCRLLWSRSAVYVHPSPKSRDNIPGFLAFLLLDACYLLAWIPTSSLSTSKEAFVLVERGEGQQQDQLVDAGLLSAGSGADHSFAVPVGQIYSLQTQPPTLSAWHGSVTVSLFGGTTLATLFFHDDESPSTSFAKESLTVKPPVTWGGEALIQKLRSYASVTRSVIEPTLFLVNPSRTDLEVHSTPVYEDLDDDPVPKHQRPKSKKKRNSILHQSLSARHGGGSSSGGAAQPQERMDPMTFGVLSAFSRVTRSARSAAQTVLSHDLARPIVPHLPPTVQTLVDAREPDFTPWQSEAGLREFNGAAVFLAKWARVVAEEGERLRREQVGASADGEEASALGAFEILAKRYDIQRPRTSRAVNQPIVQTEWKAWFDNEGRLMLTADEAKKRIFQRGLADEARPEAWLFLLNVVPWESNRQEREALLHAKREEYETLRAKWRNDLDFFKSESFVEERHRIEIDCRRTDRSHPMFSTPVNDGDEDDRALDESTQHDASDRADYEGGQPPSNKHVRRLQEVLLTYDVYERDLGYVQGMSDLCSPLYITMQGDPAMTFACFVALMNRMKPNFLRDQSGMKAQLSSLQKLILVMDPFFYGYLEKVDSMNLFFCYRWILVCFKREFPLGETLKIWENFFTDCCGQHFHLFFALAILQAHRDITTRYLQSFDELLKYINELSFTMESEPLLCQAEILYLSLRELVESEDRREAYLQAVKKPQNGESAPTRESSSDARRSVVDDTVRELLN